MSTFPPVTTPNHLKAIVVRPADQPLSPIAGDSFASELWRSEDGSKVAGSFRNLKGCIVEFDQRYHESLYIAAGRAILTVDGARYDVRAGDLVHIQPGVKFKTEVLETIQGFFIMAAANGRVEL